VEGALDAVDLVFIVEDAASLVEKHFNSVGTPSPKLILWVTVPVVGPIYNGPSDHEAV
jgi:hypothetical protein